MPPSLSPTRRSSSRLLVDLAILLFAFSLAMDLFIDETISWLSSVSPTPFVLILSRYSSSLARDALAAFSLSSASFCSLVSSISSRWCPLTFCVISDRLFTPVFCFAWAKSASSSASLEVCSFAVLRRLDSSSSFSPMVPLSRSRSGFSASVKVSWRAVLDSSRCLFHSSILDASLASICFFASSRFLDSSCFQASCNVSSSSMEAQVRPDSSSASSLLFLSLSAWATASVSDISPMYSSSASELQSSLCFMCRSFRRYSRTPSASSLTSLISAERRAIFLASSLLPSSISSRALDSRSSSRSSSLLLRTSSSSLSAFALASLYFLPHRFTPASSVRSCWSPEPPSEGESTAAPLRARSFWSALRLRVTRSAAMSLGLAFRHASSSSDLVKPRLMFSIAATPFRLLDLPQLGSCLRGIVLEAIVCVCSSSLAASETKSILYRIISGGDREISASSPSASEG
mmetsp:Transcript_33315/g.79640  ORF Transcript_33315/g.79640 Transcript_33315/m.79640 type:complete len:461 (+) Transcript_33315:365-1747(+)